jgi:methylmalonyl-CoA mutase N-terminal domain/subunit
MDQREQLQVGVNCFEAEETSVTELLTIDPKAQGRQQQKLKKFKSSRNQLAVSESLDSLRAAAKGNENLMPRIGNAVKNNCTLGEVSDTLREVFGKHKEILTI